VKTRAKSDLQKNMTQKLERLGTDVAMENADCVALFDDFVQHSEWELALHIVCDYLLEMRSLPAPPRVVEQINALHELMQIQDACVSELRARAIVV
jgi:hypothetical protein